MMYLHVRLVSALSVFLISGCSSRKSDSLVKGIYKRFEVKCAISATSQLVGESANKLPYRMQMTGTVDWVFEDFKVVTSDLTLRPDPNSPVPLFLGTGFNPKYILPLGKPERSTLFKPATRSVAVKNIDHPSARFYLGSPLSGIKWGIQWENGTWQNLDFGKFISNYLKHLGAKDIGDQLTPMQIKGWYTEDSRFIEPDSSVLKLEDAVATGRKDQSAEMIFETGRLIRLQVTEVFGGISYQIYHDCR